MSLGPLRSRDETPFAALFLRPPRIETDQARLIELNKALRARLLNFEYDEALDKSPTLEVTLANTDLYWIDPLGGADLVTEGTFVDFYYGYFNYFEQKADRTVVVRTHTIVGKPSITHEKLSFKATTEIQNILGSVVAPQWFTKSRVSEIVKKVLLAMPTPPTEDHLQIQDTGLEVTNLAITTKETVLQFLYRVARPYNYRVYLTPGDDGKPIIHFHKPGWRPARLVNPSSRSLTRDEYNLLRLDARFAETAPTPRPPPLSREELNLRRLDERFAETAVTQEKKFNEPGNGNLPIIKGTIVYRPDPGDELQSDILSFKMALEVDGTAATAEAATVDPKEGKPVSSAIGEAKKDEYPLSDHTHYGGTFLPYAANFAFDRNLGVPVGVFEPYNSSIGVPSGGTISPPVGTGLFDVLARASGLFRGHRDVSQGVLDAFIATPPRTKASLPDPNVIGGLPAGSNRFPVPPPPTSAVAPVGSETLPALPTPDVPTVETEQTEEDRRVVKFIPTGIGNRRIEVWLQASQKEAEAHTKASLEAQQAEAVKLDLELVGKPEMFIGDIWEIRGIKKYSGLYLIRSQKIVYSQSDGLKTSAHATTDGVKEANTTESSRAKDRPEPERSLEFEKRSGYGRSKILVQENRIIDMEDEGKETDPFPAEFDTSGGDG